MNWYEINYDDVWQALVECSKIKIILFEDTEEFDSGIYMANDMLVNNMMKLIHQPNVRIYKKIN